MTVRWYSTPVGRAIGFSFFRNASCAKSRERTERTRRWICRRERRRDCGGAMNNPPPLRGAPFAQRGLKLVCLRKTPHRPLCGSLVSLRVGPFAALDVPRTSIHHRETLKGKALVCLPCVKVSRLLAQLALRKKEKPIARPTGVLYTGLSFTTAKPLHKGGSQKELSAWVGSRTSAT